MKRFLVTFAVMALFVGVAVAQEDDCGYYPNEVGIFMSAVPDCADSNATYIDAPGGAGGFPCFLLISNPTDEGTGNAIESIGGFEMTVILPENWNLTSILPPGTTDFASGPNDYYVSGQIPVTGDFTVLCDLVIGSYFNGQSGGIYLNPYNGPQTIEGHMAITDGNNNFVPSKAYPISGSYDSPVAGINLRAVENEEISWGGVKSLFK